MTVAPGAAPSGLATLGARHPVGMVWLGTLLFCTGPVLVSGSQVGGVTFSFWRLWFGVALMVAATAAWRRLGGRPTSRRGWAAALGCGLAFAVHQLLFMSALKQTSVVDVTLMNTLAPIVVGFLAVPTLGEHPGPRFRLWSAVAMAGAAGVVLAGSTGPEGDPLGMALAAGNVVFYAFFFLGSKLAKPYIDTLPFLLGNMAAAAVAVSGFVVVTDVAVTPISRADLAACLAVALLPGALGHFSITWALRWVPANLPPVIMLSMPAIAGALAWVALGQSVRPPQVVAGLVTLGAVAGAVRAAPERAEVDTALVLAEET